MYLKTFCGFEAFIQTEIQLIGLNAINIILFHEFVV